MTTFYILLSIHLFLFARAFYNILCFGVKPSKSLSWVLITLLFPFTDDEISSMGSTNFDYRNFEHNYELNAILYDKEITAEIREEFDKRRNRATKINLADFSKQPKTQKTLERQCRFLSPLL